MIYPLMTHIGWNLSYRCGFFNCSRKRSVYELICPIGSQRPRMYGLPKIQIPLQPILSMCYSIQHSLVKWLIQWLKPVLPFYSGFCVDDLFTFSFIIRQLPPCIDSQFIVSFDITSLFTNVPLDEVISIYADFLYHSTLTSVPSLPESVFVELMELAPKSVSFSFNDTMYHQVDGISMGSPLGPILVNIFVGFYEKLLFDRFPKPYINLHYVVDAFACFSSRYEAVSLFHCLNDLHPSLTFTMDEEKDNKLPFLDVLVESHLFTYVTCI